MADARTNFDLQTRIRDLSMPTTAEHKEEAASLGISRNPSLANTIAKDRLEIAGFSKVHKSESQITYNIDDDASDIILAALAETRAMRKSNEGSLIIDVTPESIAADHSDKYEIPATDETGMIKEPTLAALLEPNLTSTQSTSSIEEHGTQSEEPSPEPPPTPSEPEVASPTSAASPQPNFPARNSGQE